MDSLEVAVVGCGGHAQSHFKMIADEPRMRLTAAAEINRDKLEETKEKHSPEQVFTDYREMLDKCKPDVVYVVTMPGHILPIVLDCLSRDINVSVEKSPGMSSEETEQMAMAVKNSKSKAIVSFNRRYIPEILAVRRLIMERGGAVHCGATYNKTLSPLSSPSMVSIAPDPIICDAIHHVDLIRWLAGSTNETAALPTKVYSEVQDGNRPGSHRHNAVIRFDTETIGYLASHYGVGRRVQRAEVHAEDMSAYLDLTKEPHVELYLDGKVIDAPLDLQEVGGDGFNETSHFADCIIEDKEPWSTLDDAVATMRLCEAIRRSNKGTM